MDKVTIRPVGKSAASSAATVSLIFTITTALKEDSDETDCDLIYDACEAKRPDIKGPAVGFMNALFCPEDQQQIKSLGFPVLAATIDGKPVGLGSLMPYHITLNPSFIVQLVIMVQPSLHRQSIATKLWLALLKHPCIQEKKIHVIVAKVAGSNAAAINGLIKAGFKHTGNEEQHYFANGSNRLQDMLHFELVLSKAPDVSALGWPAELGAGQRRTQKIVCGLESDKLDYRQLRPGDESSMQAIQDYLAATDLDVSDVVKPRDWGVRMVRRMLASESPCIIVLDRKSGVAVGWANWRRDGLLRIDSRAPIRFSAMFSLNLPGVIMRTDVVSNIWNLLHEANQALGEFRVTSLTTGACRDDLPRRNIFEGPLGFQKAYSVTGEYVKFGRLRSAIYYRLQLAPLSRETAARFKVFYTERSFINEKNWTDFVPSTSSDVYTPEHLQASEDRTEPWSIWFKRRYGWIFR